MRPPLNSLEAWLEWQQSLHFSEIDMGLARMQLLASRLDILRFPFPIISVAGTNGKGSSVSMLDAIYQAAGYKTGAYTSPFLYHYNERITISGEPCSDAEIIQVFEQIEDAREDTTLTYFEFSTLAALLLYKQKGVDIALLEVGMGGRLDAVNTWDADVALISSIGIDHVKWLGDNREVIGHEKAGIMRTGRAVICGDPNPPESIKKHALAIDAKLQQTGMDFSWQHQNDTWQWSNDRRSYERLPKPNLQGGYQYQNAANVLAVIDALSEQLPVSEEAIHQGLTAVKLQGRLQIIQSSPQIVLDVAHNAHAATELAKWLESQPCRGRTLAFFSMLSDKNIQDVLSHLHTFVDEWIIFPLEDERGFTKSELERAVAQAGNLQVCTVHESIKSAWEACQSTLHEDDQVIVFGSFSVLAEFKGLDGTFSENMY
ncbi:MAG: Dihydrofolate synthase (EC @ Folylpolyglutamate synthase (EC [uncultured Thiotrichaceae bacterium]|uniref:Dihydrofolate synthase/folylpolyglutamate synthase n=1 Tax=uncultured Thiotrichaceae bacterium TaxID=298394 RepID=A0A6S6T7S0_9GAMM|nr:MAG: Dihydrofolate synthase (EC @ Folylpolyglutamate synthase (EC [uncultured Thiotrichaceae bacterium]